MRNPIRTKEGIQLGIPDAKVILFEDDKTLVSALQAVLSKAGIEVFATDKAAEVSNYLSRNRVATLFVDCLLPSENGIDYIKSIRDEYPKRRLDIVLMSGVFKDPGFIRDSLRETGAIAFLRKPFGNEEFISHIKRQTVSPEVQNPRRKLYELFDKTNATAREKRKALESLEDIHGFDLPLIYSLLLDAKLSGHLNIVAQNGEVSGISFAQGLIVGVDIADKETYLGKLMIESGYLLPGDLDEVLSTRSAKKIGERLLQGNLVSPHGFRDALAHQMNIRLSRTILDQHVQINFVATEIELTSPHIDVELFQRFMNDSIASKISTEWIKVHFMKWMHSKFVKTNLFDSKVSALNMPLVASLNGLIPKLESGKSLASIIEEKAFPEDTLYKALYFLLTRGLFAIEGRSSMTAVDRLKFYHSLILEFSSKNSLDIFELMVNMTNLGDSKPEVVLREFVRMLGDEPSESKTEIGKAYGKILDAVQEAVEFQSSGHRDKLKEEQAKMLVENKLKAASLYEDAKNALQRSQYREALSIIISVSKLDPSIERLHIYAAWARLGCLDNGPTRSEGIRAIDMDMMRVAPEDKADALYCFVNGLYLKALGDTNSAKKAFEKALAMDSSMIFVRRELALLGSSIGAADAGKTDLLNADLKTLVGTLFSRKR